MPTSDTPHLLLEHRLKALRRAIERRIRQAKFHVVSLDRFDFFAFLSLNKALVLDLARCEFLARKENLLLLGNRGTGKNAYRLGPRLGCLPARLSCRSSSTAVPAA